MRISKRSFFALIIIILSMATLISGCKKQEVQTPPTNVSLITVSTSAGGNNIKLAGQIAPRFESKLSFQSKGIIKERFVNLGDRVKSGMVLMRIDPVDYTLSAQQIDSQVLAAKESLNLAEITLKRSRFMYEQNAISEQQLDQDTKNYQTALASLNSLETQKASSLQQLNYTYLIAPTDGIVSALNAEAGDVVNIAQQVMSIAKDSDWEAEVYIPENNRNLLINNLNMDTKVRFWAYPDLIINGKIREISAVADPTTRTYRVRVSLSQLPPIVDLGMTATVEFIPPGKIGIYIPLSAILGTSDPNPAVWTVESNIIKKQPVTLGQFGTDNNITSDTISE